MEPIQTDNISPPIRTPKDLLYLTLASAFGLGLSPIAPGTCGALLGVALHLLCALLLPAKLQLAGLIVAFVGVCAVHFWVTPWSVQYWQDSDPAHFVLDEVAGYLLVPLLFPYGQLWQVALWGFLLFRILDIIKIPPARQIDRQMHGAMGILLDDLVSAGYAVVILHLLKWLGPRLGMDAWLIHQS